MQEVLQSRNYQLAKENAMLVKERAMLREEINDETQVPKLNGSSGQLIEIKRCQEAPKRKISKRSKY
jgi:hypothetical protein